MRYSSAFRSHTSSPDVDDSNDFSFSPPTLYTSNPYIRHPIDLFDNNNDDANSIFDKSFELMSTTPFQFGDPTLLGLDFESQDLDAAFQTDGSAGLQDSVLSSGPSQGAWPQFGYSDSFQQGYYQQHQQHHQLGAQHAQPHRRALSTASSVPSYGAPDSPYSRASSVQYPTAYPPGQQYLQPQPMWDGGYSSPTAGAQHLPTPSHTPKSDSQMGSKIRNSPLPRSDSAHIQARRSHRNASAGHDGPLTPRTVNGEEVDAPGAHAAIANRAIPKFDRTMSDICQDELYNPNSATSAAALAMPQPAYAQGQAHVTPQQNLIHQRLNEANMGRVAQMQDARQPSPFRSGSVFAGQMPYTAQPQPHASAALRDQARAKAEALAMQQQPGAFRADQQQQPQTVSPKDAFPEQPAPEEENMPSLFPASSSQSDMSAMYAPHNANQLQGFGRPSMPNGHSSFATPSAPAGSQEHQGRHAGSGMPDFPAHLASMETTRSEASDRTDSPDVKVERPADTSSGAGTYTCTYHGCTERFSSPAMLQRHKRDAHRSTGAGGAAALQSSTDNSAAQMTQAGPHKCTRTNPATGKPCNAIFSRPYDLTRHEDTIHAERKKVRCPHCTEDKTFSRADALTRHLRVVHPHVSFPGKHRRRNAA